MSALAAPTTEASSGETSVKRWSRSMWKTNRTGAERARNRNGPLGGAPAACFPPFAFGGGAGVGAAAVAEAASVAAGGAVAMCGGASGASAAVLVAGRGAGASSGSAGPTRASANAPSGVATVAIPTSRWALPNRIRRFSIRRPLAAMAAARSESGWSPSSASMPREAATIRPSVRITTATTSSSATAAARPSARPISGSTRSGGWVEAIRMASPSSSIDSRVQRHKWGSAAAPRAKRITESCGCPARIVGPRLEICAAAGSFAANLCWSAAWIDSWPRRATPAAFAHRTRRPFSAHSHAALGSRRNAPIGGSAVRSRKDRPFRFIGVTTSPARSVGRAPSAWLTNGE